MATTAQLNTSNQIATTLTFGHVDLCRHIDADFVHQRLHSADRLLELELTGLLAPLHCCINSTHNQILNNLGKLRQI